MAAEEHPGHPEYLTESERATIYVALTHKIKAMIALREQFRPENGFSSVEALMALPDLPEDLK